MAFPADYLDAADLRAALASPGLLNEDVRQQVYNLDLTVPTPFTDMVGEDSFSNPYSEWPEDSLADVDTTNAVSSGAEAPAEASATSALRIGNHAQISTKYVYISTRGEEIDSVAGIGTMAYQTGKKVNELRRDIEAIALTGQASIVDTPGTTVGKTAGFDAWLKTNTQFLSSTDGTDGGFNTSTKVVDAVNPGADAGALTFASIRTAVDQCYNANSMPTTLMTVPKLIKGLNTFLFSDSGAPFRATPTANVSGTAPTDQVAQGWIDVIKTDYGFTIKLVSNRLQQTYTADDSDVVASVFLIDPRYVTLSYLYGYKTEDLAKTGLGAKKQISADWMTKVFREDAHAVIRDVDPDAAVTA